MTTHLKHGRLRYLTRRLWEQRVLVLMALPFLVWMIIFNYLPLSGWIMAFENYKPRLGMLGSPWVGLKYFSEFLQDKRFYEVLRNTFCMSGLNILFGTACAILLAVFLSEVRNKPFKRTVQTISYLPHFISWVVVSNIFYTFLSSEGLLNDILLRLGIIDETVMSLVQQKPDDIVRVGIDADELAVTKAESKATYGEIQARVKEQTGLNVTPLYIAQVKRKHGILSRECYNKAKSESAKMLICPPDKEKAIEEALRFFGMIA